MVHYSVKGDFTIRDRLILEHKSFVRYIARCIAMRLPSHVDINDLISAGILGLIDAAERYDSSRGVKFRTYAEIRIRGAIIDELRMMDWIPRSIRRVIDIPFISLDGLVDYGDKKRNILSCLADPKSPDVFDMLGLSETKHTVTKAIEDLPEKEKQVISLYYYDELTMKEIGKMFGLTESQISRIHTSAILRLRVRINNVNFKERLKEIGSGNKSKIQ